MTITIQQPADTRLSVHGELDFATAPAALELVSARLATGREWVLDLGGVTRTNSVGLAVMIEWLALTNRSGGQLRYENVPDALLKVARVCEVDGLLGLTR